VAEARVQEVHVPRLELARLVPVIGEERYTELGLVAAAARSALAGTAVWNVNSTATGGGVAEMLEVLVGYAVDLGIDARWLVIEGDPEFFAITKRIHNRLHGFGGDKGELGPRQAAHYDKVLADNAAALTQRVRPGDVVLLHDPQTAGLAGAMAGAGASVVWRCHIGADRPNRFTEEAWALLRPHLEACDGYVFSRRAFVPGWVPQEKVTTIAPSVDPYSPKNQHLDQENVLAILARLGVVGQRPDDGAAHFVRPGGATGRVTRSAVVVGEPVPEGAELVVQVSRWDHLKDMGGVLAGFVGGVVGRADAHLALVGPAVAGVSDDPEGDEVYHEVLAAWEALPEQARVRVRLVSLPMDDVEENGAMVNAIQRAASVVVQKSLVEGFGLTVAEAMWKGKPVVASAIGGIVDQLAPDAGVLLDDPADLDAFGSVLAGLLGDPDERRAIGERARRRVTERLLTDRHLLAYAGLLERLVGS